MIPGMKAVLKENTTEWDLFVKLPMPFEYKVYIFDVQNPTEILQGAKPVVREVGPYVYKLYRWKSDIEWQQDEISYYDYSRYEFDKNASSPHSDEDVVTVLNSPFNSLILTVEEMSPQALATVDSVLPDIFKDKSGLFMNVTVRDFLFGGFAMCENSSSAEFAVKMVCDQVRAKAAATKPMWTTDSAVWFANFHYRNYTHLGRYTIKSGANVKEELSDLVQFDNKSTISTWVGGAESKCNRIRGTTTFHPYVTTDMKFDVFGEDICRTLEMDYKNTETVKGIKGYKYVVRNDSFDAPKEGSGNYCFCINKSRTLSGDFGCLGDGLMDMSTCIGAPVLLSFPHFLYADEEYKRTVSGLRPDEAKHETFVVLEPTSGVPLQMAKRVQFNMFIRTVEDIASFENITNAIVPIFWVEESIILSDEYINMIKTVLLNNLLILNIITWVLMGIGLTAMIAPLIRLIYN